MRDNTQQPVQLGATLAAARAPSRRHSVPTFVALLFVLSVPIWIASAVTDVELLSGFPLSALMAFLPGIAVAILVFQERGSSGLGALLARSVDYERIDHKIWYVPILALTPAMMVLAYVAMRVVGMPLPTPHISVPTVPWLAFPNFGSTEGLASTTRVRYGRGRMSAERDADPGGLMSAWVPSLLPCSWSALVR